MERRLVLSRSLVLTGDIADPNRQYAAGETPILERLTIVDDAAMYEALFVLGRLLHDSDNGF